MIPWRTSLLAALVLTMAGLGACGPTASRQTPSPATLTQPVEQVLTLFVEQQQKRRQALKGWRVTGILDLDLPDDGRRHRTVVAGVGIESARMEVHGPFRQIMGELWLQPRRLLMIEPGEKRVIQAPPTAQGMARLIGFELDPFVLLEAMLGIVSEKVHIPRERTGERSAAQGVMSGLSEGRVDLLTSRGDRLVVGADDGLLHERMGYVLGRHLEQDQGQHQGQHGEQGLKQVRNRYHVRYIWPRQPFKDAPPEEGHAVTTGEGGASAGSARRPGSASPAAPPLMPRRVVLDLHSRGVITLIFKRWDYPAADKISRTPTIPSDFQWMR